MSVSCSCSKHSITHLIAAAAFTVTLPTKITLDIKGYEVFYGKIFNWLIESSPFYLVGELAIYFVSQLFILDALVDDVVTQDLERINKVKH